MTILEQLLEVRRLLSPKGAWIQGGSAKDDIGQWVESINPRACSWCLYGASRCAAMSNPLNELRTGWVDLHERLSMASHRVFGKYDYIAFNDDHLTTQAQVLEIVDDAITEERKLVNGKP